MKRYTIAASIAAAAGMTLSLAAPATAAVVPNGTLALLAVGESATIRTLTTGNTTTNHNGSEWYYWNGNSLGFADTGATVDLDSADVSNDADDWSRLSWHIHSDGGPYYIGNGYRVGDSTGLNGGAESEATGRFIFVADTLPGYYPSGPQTDVNVDLLDGWTLCWSNLYSDDSAELGLLSDVWTACDGEYLMYAAGDMVDGDFTEFNGTGEESSSSNGLADTGFDSGALVLASVGLLAAGTIVAVRRRRNS